VFFTLNTVKLDVLARIFSITYIDSQIFFSKVEKELIETNNPPD